MTSSAKSREYFARLEAAHPNPRCELYYETPYQLLVSVVLSAQATDVSVNRCMEPLHRAGFSPEQLLSMGEQQFLQKIKTIGLAPTKSKNVFALTKKLLNEHGGRVPKEREALEALPGVGRKTASVVMGEIFGEPTLAVDTHVFRVGQRLNLHKESNPKKAEEQMLRKIPLDLLPRAHHWMVLHGRYTCKARAPLCESCVLADLCPWFKAK